nr:hypothetical protein Iba_chr13eCG2470 [Ipomoea batatas]
MANGRTPSRLRLVAANTTAEDEELELRLGPQQLTPLALCQSQLRSVRGSEGKRVAGNGGSFLQLAGDVLQNRPAAGGRRNGGIGRPTWEILDHGLMGRRNGFGDFKSGETP